LIIQIPSTASCRTPRAAPSSTPFLVTTTSSELPWVKPSASTRSLLGSTKMAFAGSAWAATGIAESTGDSSMARPPDAASSLVRKGIRERLGLARPLAVDAPVGAPGSN
jgi:hypothetical protein